MGPGTISHVAHAVACVEFFFYAVYSSKLDSDIVVLSVEHIMEASVAVRPGLVLNSVVIVCTRG